MENIVGGKLSVDEDSLDQMNLLMLLEAKTSNDTITMDKIKSYSEDIVEKVIANFELPNNSTTLFGGSMYSGQIFTLQNETLAKNMVIQNNLPTFNVSGC